MRPRVWPCPARRRRLGRARRPAMIGPRRAAIWDVIVIGAGMGGGIAGRRLAEKGLSVLFVERGPNGSRDDEAGLDAAINDPASAGAGATGRRRSRPSIDGRPVDVLRPVRRRGRAARRCSTRPRWSGRSVTTSTSVRGRPHPTGGWPVGYDAFLPVLRGGRGAPRRVRRARSAGRGTAAAAAPAAAPVGGRRGDDGGLPRGTGLHPYRKHVGRPLPARLHRMLRAQVPARLQDGRALGRGRAGARHRARGAARRLRGASALRGARGRVTHLEAVRGGAALDVRGEALRARGRGARIAAPAAGLRERGLAGRAAPTARAGRAQPDVPPQRAHRDLAGRGAPTSPARPRRSRCATSTSATACGSGWCSRWAWTRPTATSSTC